MERKSSTRRNVYQLVKEGQIEKAISTLGEFLAAGEGGPYDFVYMGDLLLRVERTADAIGRYEEAIAANARLGFNRNAIALCRKILRIDPARRDIQRRLGDLHAAEEFVGDALHAYFAYLEQTEEEDRLEEGFRETLLRVEELAPQRADLAIRASDFCRKIERFDTAVSILTRAAEVAEAEGRDPQAAELRDRLAAVSPAMLGVAAPEGFEAGAVDAPAAEDAPGAADAPGDADRIQYEAGDDAEDEVPVYEILGEDEDGEAEEAGRTATAAGDPLAWGEVELGRGAEEAQEAGIDRDDFRTHYQRGTVFMEQGRLDEALAEFEAAARDYDLTSEQGARLQETRGRCFSALGRHREAIREFTLLLQSAARAGTDRAGALVLLARELEAVGDLDEARKRLQEALEAHPDMPEAAAYLEQLDRRAA